MKLSPNWLLASALPLLTEAVPLACLGTTVNAFLCPNTSSKPPEHPNRKENKSTYPAYSNTIQRQEMDLRSIMYVFLFILQCCTKNAGPCACPTTAPLQATALGEIICFYIKLKLS